MRMRNVLAALAALILAAPITASAQQQQQTIQFSTHAGLGAPVGRLGDNTNMGFNLGLRGEMPMNPKWGFRGDASWDRFGRRAASGSYSYYALAGNLTHYESPRLYEFGGLGVYRSEVSGGSGLTANDNNLGIQGGVGLNMTADQLKTFVEFGLTGVFAQSTTNWWFPVRVGIRF